MVFLSGPFKDVLVYFKEVPKWMCSESMMGINGFLDLIFPPNSIVTALPLPQLLKSVSRCVSVLPA